MKTVVESLVTELRSLATKVEQVSKVLPTGITARDTLSDLYNHLLDAAERLTEDLDEVPEA